MIHLFKVKEFLFLGNLNKRLNRGNFIKHWIYGSNYKVIYN